MSTRYSLKNKIGPIGLAAGVWNLGPGTDPFGALDGDRRVLGAVPVRPVTQRITTTMGALEQAE